jgi:hypothetical protein
MKKPSLVWRVRVYLDMLIHFREGWRYQHFMDRVLMRIGR